MQPVLSFFSHYGLFLFLALIVFWMIWMRFIAPKRAGVLYLSAHQYRHSWRKKIHTLLDVRSANEYATAHAPAAILIPLQDLPARIEEVPKDKPIVVICASGNRSIMGATALGKRGYRPVYNFSGGMAAWKMAKLPIDQE